MDADFPEGMLPDIERFLQDIAPTLPSGQDLYSALFSTGLFFPLQRQEELHQTISLIRSLSPPSVFCEIGADKGSSVWHWCKSFPSISRVIACEIRGTPYFSLFEAAFPDVDFFWFPASSLDPKWFRQMSEWLGGDRIDCLFLDGDKGAFLDDFDLYRPLVSPGGRVLLHDITEAGPGAAFSQIKRRGYDTRTIHDISDSLSAIEREKEGIPSASAHEGWLRQWQGRSCGVGVVEIPR